MECVSCVSEIAVKLFAVYMNKNSHTSKFVECGSFAPRFNPNRILSPSKSFLSFAYICWACTEYIQAIVDKFNENRQKMRKSEIDRECANHIGTGMLFIRKFNASEIYATNTNKYSFFWQRTNKEKPKLSRILHFVICEQNEKNARKEKEKERERESD